MKSGLGIHSTGLRPVFLLSFSYRGYKRGIQNYMEKSSRDVKGLIENNSLKI